MSTAPHLALLGDSVFDNRTYTGGEPEVAAHLRGLLPAWKVTLCAIDGATTTDVGAQLDRVPAQATPALGFGLDVIELRLVCTEPADFANPIEPSGSGGLKIARAIGRALGAGEGEASRKIRVTAG